VTRRAAPSAGIGAASGTESNAGFSADWLQQREPLDAAARDAAAPHLDLHARFMAWRQPAAAPLRVIDLGCGTGANLRWLAPRLSGAQQWLVVDHDAALLRRWPACLAAATAAGVRARRGGDTGKDADSASDARSDSTNSAGANHAGASGTARTLPDSRRLLRFSGPGFDAHILRRRLDLALDLERLPWPAAQLVTGSALLDLVSDAWLQRLVAATAGAQAALLMALSVDGRHHWAPGDADDATVATLFAAHQQRDKGFGGPALGAAAAPALLQTLRRHGYCVHRARSDWLLDGRRDVQALGLQRALIDGMAAAALEQASAGDVRTQARAQRQVQAWQRRRQALAPHSVLRLGHLDVLALPPG
jgi:SAM-dependent methyltransferase